MVSRSYTFPVHCLELALLNGKTNYKKKRMVKLCTSISTCILLLDWGVHYVKLTFSFKYIFFWSR